MLFRWILSVATETGGDRIMQSLLNPERGRIPIVRRFSCRSPPSPLPRVALIRF